MFDNLTAGNTKKAMAAYDAGRSDMYQIEPARLRIMEGFNVRVRDEAYTARVRWLADSIKANGFYRDKPLAGYVAIVDGEEVVYVTDGHRRHEAALLAISEGAPIPHVPIVIAPKGTSLEDLTVAMANGNESEPLRPYEYAILCKRLVSMGMDAKTIAQRLGFASAQYVDGLLSLAGAPQAVRKMVEEGTVAATVAIEAMAKHGDKAAEVLGAAKATAQAAGKTKVTRKHMPGADGAKAIKKAAPAIWAAVNKVHSDPGYLNLSAESRAVVDDLIKQLA